MIQQLQTLFGHLPLRQFCSMQPSVDLKQYELAGMSTWQGLIAAVQVFTVTLEIDYLSGWQQVPLNWSGSVPKDDECSLEANQFGLGLELLVGHNAASMEKFRTIRKYRKCCKRRQTCVQADDDFFG
ncbi:hypothetical protein KIN20_017416 [Parelaphostrongylus tenuis]|uniref:Uncharacterized protein n=1 Tax=Parelaphostrongylus tenuis TaxID=148309 RepID=A0AAD5QRF8_PARTN|nr:hypothetical protein KIN20_017416 [Parelaphostrongylus tenuis]